MLLLIAMKRFSSIVIPLAVILILVVLAEPAMAQCPMCKTAVESSLQSGDNTAVGINKGILYLLVMPYLFYAVIFLAWYWSNRKKVAAE